MKCKFDKETLKLIALAIGTANRKKEGEVEEHYLRYISMKLLGQDGLSLDLENEKIFQKLKEIVEETTTVTE